VGRRAEEHGKPLVGLNELGPTNDGRLQAVEAADLLWTASAAPSPSLCHTGGVLMPYGSGRPRHRSAKE
jgi:hypothetical protein